MKIFIAIAFPFAVFVPSASARIGETEAQIQTRYEKSVGDIPTKTFGVMRGFISAGYIIGVALRDGVSEMEMVSKADQADMSASEIAKLLKENSPGEWKAEQTGKPNWRRWRSEDQSLVALYDTVRHFLYINSKKFYEETGRKLEEHQAAQPTSPTPSRP